MATTPGGLVYPVTTDAFDPSGDMADLAASADVGRIVPVPNAAARAALATAYGPTPARPLYVDRQDASAFLSLERTTDGANWAAVLGAVEQTITWQGSRYTPSGFERPRLYALGNLRIMTPGAIGSTVAFTQGSLNLGTIPAGHRPAGSIRTAAKAGVSGVADPMLEVSSAGVVQYVWLAAVTMAANTYCVSTAVIWAV